MKRLKFFIFILSLLTSYELCAENLLIIKIENNSHQTLVFEPQKTIKKPANSFAINNPIISPGETVIISGITTTGSDLVGHLFFAPDASLYIVDPRQFHLVHPVFSFNSPNIIAGITFTHNPLQGARLLKISEVTLVLKDKAKL